MLDIDTLQLGMNCLVSVTLLVLSGLHHIIPAQGYSMPYGTCVYTTKQMDSDMVIYRILTA